MLATSRFAILTACSSYPATEASAAILCAMYCLSYGMGFGLKRRASVPFWQRQTLGRHT
jgi:hypothetical protein